VPHAAVVQFRSRSGLRLTKSRYIGELRKRPA
jgi:hypothetical protein